MSEVVSAELARTVVLNAPMWMAKRLPLSGPLGDDVTQVSATLLDTVGPDGFQRQQPGSSTAWLSAIGYPAPGTAVIGYWATGSRGAARVERQRDGGWRVAVSAVVPETAPVQEKGPGP